MATGNLGDLEMSLTLKSRVEDEVKNIVRSMNALDASGKRAQEAIDAISSAFKSMHKGTADVTKLSAVLEKLNGEIDLEKSMDFPNAKTLTKLNKVTEGLERVKDVLGQMSKDGAKGFNIFPNGISSEVNAAQKAMNKLSGIAKELNKWEGKGLQLFDVKNTDNIRQVSSELLKYRSILEQIRNNGGTHPITGLTASDITKSAEYIAALDKAKVSAKEVKQAIADANLDAKISADIEKERQQLMAKEAAEKESLNKKEQEYQLRQQAILDLERQVTEEKRKQAEKNKATDRKIDLSIEKERQQLEDEYLSKLSKEGVIAQQNAETQRRLLEQQRDMQGRIAQENAKSEIKWNEQLTKARTDALKKQMEADVAAERNAKVLLSSNGFDVSTFEKRVAMLNRMKDIQEKLAFYQPKVQYAWLDYETSLKSGNANTPTLRHKEDELQRLRTLIADLEAEFNKLGGNKVFADVDNQIKSLEQTIERLKGAGALNLGKMLGLENKSTDEFRIAKEAAMATESHTKKQNELNAAFEKYFQEQERIKAAEERLAAAMAKTNQARREAVAASRQQAEALVRDRIKELEAQQQQLKGLYSSKNGSLSEESLSKVKSAFSKITKEVETLRSALSNLGSYSIDELFSRVRKTSDLSPMIKAVELEKQHQREVAETAARVKNDLANAFSGVNREASKTSQILGDIKSLFLQGGIVFGAKQFFDSIVQTGGEIVQQHVALRSILGDVQKADELFAQTQQLALQSPFKFGELNRDVKQLAAFGVEANDLYDTTKRLADIASGLGVSFERLGLAYGQVKARSWLDGKELRQFAYAGLPLLQKIAELYNSTGKNGKTDYKAGDIKKMITNREVSFEDVQKVLWQMTDQGGQFYNMQLVLSDTLLGRWNKLIDAWDIMVGKMAEGKSIVGGTFSFFINRVTDLVLALDKMQPALLAFGAMFALKKGASAIGSKIGIGTNLAALQAEQQTLLRTYAVEQQKLLIEGKITQQKMQQNIADYQGFLNSKMNTRNAVEQAALEGRLSALKLQKAYAEKLISPELVKQLELMGVISAKQSELIMKSGNWAKAQLAAQGAMSKIGGFFSGWNLATIGVTIAGALYSAWSSFNSKIKQDTETTANNAKSTYESMVNVLKEVGDKKGSGEALQEQVDKMTETLKQSNLYTDSIKEQIANTNDLGKEYDILKGKIEEAKKANDFTPGEANAYARAKSATGAGFAGGGSWFGQWTGIGQDDIDENTDDVANALASLQMKMAKFGDSTKKTMEQVANSMLGAKAAGMTFEEKLATLYYTGGKGAAAWQIFVDKVSKGNEDLEGDLENLEGDIRGFGSNFKEITTDDIPKYLEEMAKSRNMSLNEFSQWCKKHPEKFRKMLDEMLSEANSKVPSLVARLQQVAKAILNISNTEPKKQDNTPKVWKNPLKEGTVDRKAFNKLLNAGKLKGGKGGFWQKEMAALIYSLNNGQSTGWENFGSSVQKAYKEARNENDAAKAAGEKAPYARKQAMLETLADQLGITLDVGKNKVTGNYGKDKHTGRQEDKELKALEERLSSYKSARQSYQKRQSYMSDEAAKKETYELFPEVTGLNLDNYEEAVKSLLNGFKINTTERKKFQTSVYREVADWLFEESDKKEFEAKAATFSEEMNKLSDRWDLYKSLLEKTGNKDFASAAFATTDFLEDEKTQRLMDLYEKHYHKRLENEDLYLTDGQAKERYKLPNQYEEWKKIVDLLRGNYVQALNDGADAINQTMSTATKLDAITAKYNKKRKDAGGDKDLIARYNYLEKQDKSSVLFEQLKSQVNWDGVFGNLDNYTKKELRKVRKDLNELIKGGVLNGMQSSDVQSFYEGVNKLNNAIDGKSFGGMAELVKELADASKQYDDAVKEYNLALASGADWQIEAAKKKMQAAETLKRTAQGNINTKKGVNFGNIMTLGNMFATLGKSDGSGSTLLSNAGSWAETIAKMSGSSDKNSSKIGSIVGMMAGLTEAIGEKGFGGFLSDAFEDIGNATNSIFKDLLGINLGIGGANYDDYNDAKAEYENLISVWDTLISKKKQYMSEHWGTEAENASKEAMALLESEIEQTKVTAKKRLGAGASIGSHSIAYRMWQGSYDYNGTNWKDVAGEISSKYGVQFNSMEDMLNMSAETLEKIEADYSGLWANMDSDFKDYLDKIIEYGDQVDDMTESLTEKLTGNKFSDLVSSWGSAMATMANSSDSLVEHFESNLKNAILNSMIENIYGKQIKSLMSKTQSYAENNDKITSSDGSTISEYTGEEYAEIINDTEELSKQIEATRDYLKNTYHWSDDSSSSSTNTVKGVTEETADIIVSYLNAIRLDVSVNRENIKLIADAVGDIPDLTVIARSQLTQLDSIAQNTLRNADAAEEIASLFKAVTNGTKKVYMN